MRISIKSLSFMGFLSMFIACSSPTNTTPTNSEEPTSTIIKGMVTSIEDGKDGYTADVRTNEEGVYAALVSIVNMGGPENYQRVNIGDRVTLEGTPYKLGDQQQLKVERIINVAPTRTQLIISPISFRGITVGDKIADHSDYLVEEQLQTGEGDFLIYRIKDFKNNPAGYILPDPTDEFIVGDITVETQMASTVRGIRVGSTLQDLQKAFPDISIHGSEIEGRTYAVANNLAYRLDAVNFTYEIDKATIPMDSKITEIVIRRNPSQVHALNDKYSQIDKEEYCWQVNKVLNLYTKPTTNSLVQGKHFQGEVLSVLGTQLIDGQLWVNVTYQLVVKAGYEHQFADGQVHSSGVPTGWIGGADITLINCK